MGIELDFSIALLIGAWLAVAGTFALFGKKGHRLSVVLATVLFMTGAAVMVLVVLPSTSNPEEFFPFLKKYLWAALAMPFRGLALMVYGGLGIGLLICTSGLVALVIGVRRIENLFRAMIFGGVLGAVTVSAAMGAQSWAMQYDAQRSARAIGFDCAETLSFQAIMGASLTSDYGGQAFHARGFAEFDHFHGVARKGEALWVWSFWEDEWVLTDPKSRWYNAPRAPRC